MQGRHTYNFCFSKGFYSRYTFCILSIYLSERVYLMSKMAQSNMHKTNLNSWQLFPDDPFFWVFFAFFCVAIKIAVFIWWRVNDRRNSNKVTWSDSIFFRFLATWECFIGKIYHANILPTDISSNLSKDLLISDGIIIKSKITNAWVIFSSTNCSLLTKVIFNWVLTKPFCQNIFDIMLQKKLNRLK